MPKLSMPEDLPGRTTTPLLMALAVVFLLGSMTADPALARKDTTGTEISEQTIVQESTPSEGASGRSVGSGDVKVGNGEAIAGDAYAGNGCARAGDVTAGDCDQMGAGGGFQNGGPNNGGSGGEDSHEAAPPEEDHGMTAPETTTEESTTEEPDPEGTTPEDTTLEETTLPEETSVLEETTVLEELTSSASPVPDEGALCPARPPEDAVEATVEGTADGDTLELAEEVDGYDTVRLIGVDTPELGEAGEEEQPEPLAQEASEFAADELEGQEVLLQVGEEEVDRYGRLLAYVWDGAAKDGGFIGGLKRMVGMGEPELFNRVLLKKGYAEVLTIEPNDLYADCLEDAEREARDAGLGIWAEDEDTGGSPDDQYAEDWARETTAEAPPLREPETEPAEQTPAEITPTEETLEGAAPTDDDPATEEPERQASPAHDQYEESPPPEARSPEPEVQEEEVQDPEVQEEEVQEPEVRESVAPSGGDEAAALETEASPTASVEARGEAGASPEPAGQVPVRAASTTPASVLPETGGPSLLAIGARLAAAGLLAGIAPGLVAVRSFLRRDLPGGR